MDACARLHPHRRLLAAATGAVIVAALLASCSSDSDSGANRSKAAPTTSREATVTTSSASVPASAQLVGIMVRAVQEERHAKATYDNVVAVLGDIAPFVNIARSEAQHITALERVAAAYGIDTASASSTGEASPSTKRAACQLGVDAEKADVALYDELLPQVSAWPDVTRVFESLRSASLDSHLPAFERCN